MSDVADVPSREEARYRAMQALDPLASDALESFIGGLHDESWRVRHAAAEGLQRLPEASRVATRLISVLGERGEAGARNAAAEALAGLGDAALGPLVRLLAHEDPDQRKFAADILGQLGRRGDVVESVLVRALGDGDLNVRVSAAEALGRVGGAGAARALESLLDADESLLRLAALEGLALLGQPPPLDVALALADDVSLRRSALRVLGLRPERAALERVCAGLGVASRSVLEAALGALGTQVARRDGARRDELDVLVRGALAKLPDAASRVQRALESEDVSVRAGALLAAGVLEDAALAVPVAEVAREDRLLREVLHTLGRLGPEGGRVLLRHMGELSLPARTAATEALVDLVDADSVPALESLLDWAEDDLRAVVVRALGRTSAPEAVRPLVELLGDPSLSGAAMRALVALAEPHASAVLKALDESVSRRATPAAVAVLGRVGGALALPVLRRLARDAEPAWRAAAVEAAGEVDFRAGGELARGALADEAAAVRIAAVRATGRLGGPDAAALLRPALADEDLGVRLAGVDAVGECGALERVPELEMLARHEDGALAVQAVRALARLGAAGPEVLRGAAGHADSEVVKAALAAGAGTPPGWTLAEALLGHAEWDVRAAAARVLGDVEGPGAEEALRLAQRALGAETDSLARRALLDTVERLSRR
ncbi:HEAT repeat domain-containing protein [Myxococcaceae bacterium JPH2]|nr:HEAT repeat domain-containing protein [Myxococcaceae bacterium JPH2]